MKWQNPQVTQKVRDAQDHPVCSQSLSFPIHEHISSDTREPWLAVGLEETQRRPSEQEVHLVRVCTGLHTQAVRTLAVRACPLL